MTPAVFLVATCVAVPQLAMAEGRYTCQIDMTCAGVWTDCAPADLSALMDVPPDRAPVTLGIANTTTMVFENVAHVTGPNAVSASGIDPATGQYVVLTYLDGRLGVVLSADASGQGLFHSTGSFAGTCERAE